MSISTPDLEATAASRDQRAAPGEIGHADPRALKNWQVEHTNNDRNNYRLVLTRTWELNRLYTQLNQQWLEPALMGLQAGDGTYTINPFFQSIMDGQSYQARPVQNELISIIQNEVARLIAGGTDFKVTRTERSTRIEKAAKLGEAVLEAQNEELGWKDLERELCRDLCLFGTGLIRTGQITDWEDTVKKTLDVLGCPECGWITLADEHKDGLIKGKEAFDIVSKFGGKPHNFRIPEFGGVKSLSPVFDDPSADLDPQEPVAQLDRCPMCGAQKDGGLIPRAPKETEAKDYAGRDTSTETPKSNIEVNALSPYDWFPSGNGRVDPDRKIRSWHRESIVSLDWVSKHFEKGYCVRPDSDIKNIAQWHPFGIEDGRPALQTTNKRDLDEFCVLRESIRPPYFEEVDGKRVRRDMGRWTVSAGSEILIDDVLMIRDKRSDKLIPRVEVNACQWEPLKGSIHGAALITYCRSMQDDINTAKAQAIEVRHGHGNPKVLLGPGTNIEFAGQVGSNYQNDVMRYFGSTAPTWIPGMALNDQWRYEMQLNQDAIQRAGQSRDVEQGEVPKGVTSGTALSLLAEKASVTRGARIDSKKQAVQRSLSHRLALMGVIFVTPRDFVASERGDRQSINSFIGADLCGQMDVKVKTIPFVESPLIQREAAAEAVSKGYLELRTAGDRSRFLESQGVPPDIAPGDGIQIDTAKGEWLAYVEIVDTPGGESAPTYKIAPIVKAGFDQPQIHVEQHIEDLKSSEGEALRKNWNEIVRLTYGWKEDRQRVKAAELALKMNPPGKAPLDAPPDPMTMLPDPKLQAAETDKWLAEKELQSKIAAAPRLPELAIQQQWLKMLAQAGFKPDANDLALIRWLAHIEGHIEEADTAMAVAAAGPQQPPGTVMPTQPAQGPEKFESPMAPAPPQGA